MSTSAKLIFLCGKMAAGKTTLARDLARRENAVLLVEDAFLDSLFPGEITDIAKFITCSSRLKNALAPQASDANPPAGAPRQLTFGGEYRAFFGKPGQILYQSAQPWLPEIRHPDPEDPVSYGILMIAFVL